MWFFHKYGEKITRQLLYNDSEFENKKDDGESMPLEDKLSLWWDEARCSASQIDENRCIDDEDISLGGEDEGNTSGEDNDDQDIENTEASSHNKIVLESSALRWLVRSLRNEIVLQEDCDGNRGHDSRVHVRKKVLHHLATGEISKSRSPIVHKVMLLPIKQYFQQTWPTTCSHIMNLLQYSSNDNGETFVGKYVQSA
ncbi:hypothetical protein CGCTS75_v008725 [Colletotrichum tropicale]|nr:hypothetical protein CGCTS75_v008725 [Colletotrichum tropicale]